jgi:cell division protein FtsW
MWLLGAIIGLLMIGIVIIYSAGEAWARTKGIDDPSAFFLSHIVKICIGIFGMLLVAMIPPHLWKRYALMLLIVGVVLTLAVHLPVIGKHELGASRWIRFPIVWQPSEFLRIVYVLAIAAYLDRNIAYLHTWKKGIIAPLVVIAVPLFALYLQPSMSMIMILFFTGSLMLYFAGVPWSKLLKVAGVALVVLPILVLSAGYRKDRILSHFGLGSTTDAARHADVSHQQEQALIAFGNGGFTGKGLGEGTQKLGYLPEPFNDMVLATLGEETGFIGVTVVLLFTWLFTWRGLLIARDLKEPFYRFAAFGLTMNFTVNVMIHTAVCFKLMPATGQTLPLVSYGGTNLIMSLGGMGILLALSMQREPGITHQRGFNLWRNAE